MFVCYHDALQHAKVVWLLKSLRCYIFIIGDFRYLDVDEISIAVLAIEVFVKDSMSMESKRFNIYKDETKGKANIKWI